MKKIVIQILPIKQLTVETERFKSFKTPRILTNKNR